MIIDLKNFGYYFSITVVLIFALQVTTACSPKSRKTPVTKAQVKPNEAQKKAQGKLQEVKNQLAQTKAQSINEVDNYMAEVFDIPDLCEEVKTTKLVDFNAVEGQFKLSEVHIGVYAAFSADKKAAFALNSKKLSPAGDTAKSSKAEIKKYTELNESSPFTDSTLKLLVPGFIAKKADSVLWDYQQIQQVQVSLKNNKILDTINLVAVDSDIFDDENLKEDKAFCKKVGTISTTEFFPEQENRDSLPDDGEMRTGLEYDKFKKHFIFRMNVTLDNDNRYAVKAIYKK